MIRIIKKIIILALIPVSVALFFLLDIIAFCTSKPIEIDMPDKETEEVELLAYLNKKGGGGYKMTPP